MRELNIDLNVLNIDCRRIQENYLKIKEFIGKSKVCSASLLKNAYNLGSAKVMESLSKFGCDEFFVNNLDEAIKLREVSLTDKIFVMNPMITGEESDFIKYQIIPVISSLEQYNMLSRYCKINDKKFEAVLNVDTGLNCSGLTVDEARNLFKSDIFNKYVKVIFLISELVYQADPKNEFNYLQLKIVNELKDAFNIPVSLVSSEAIALGENFFCDRVRPGIALFGADKNYNEILDLKPAINLKSKIILVKEMLEEQKIGYEHLKELEPGAIIATIPIGYGDGIPSSIANKVSFYINGQEAPVVGSVYIDKIIIDVSKVNKNFVHVGADVEIIGENSSISSICASLSMKPHEFIANLNSSLKRNYIT